MPYIVYAPAQTNQTGLAIAALRDDVRQFLTTSSVTYVELKRTIDGAIYALQANMIQACRRSRCWKRTSSSDGPDDYAMRLQGAVSGEKTIAACDQPQSFEHRSSNDCS